MLIEKAILPLDYVHTKPVTKVIFFRIAVIKCSVHISYYLHSNCAKLTIPFPTLTLNIMSPKKTY